MDPRRFWFITRPAGLVSVPAELPILILSGELDPVLGKGLDAEGGYVLQRALVAVGVQSVRHAVYSGMRHEVFNEIGAEGVYEDCAAFIFRCCGAEATKARL